MGSLRLIAALSLTLPLLAAPIYNVSIIPNPGRPGDMRAIAINSSGLVAGQFRQNAFLGTPTGTLISATAPFGITYATLNDSGALAGSFYDDRTPPPVSGSFTATSSSSIINTPLTGDVGTITYALNNSGNSVGLSASSSLSRATFWDSAGNPTAITVPSAWIGSVAADINALDQVVGTGYLATGAVAFVGSVSGVTVVTLPGFAGVNGAVINDRGDLAGTATNGAATAAADEVWFRPAGGAVMLIPRIDPAQTPFLGGGNTAMNNRGQVVGFSQNFNVQSQRSAWIWDASGGMRNLNDLVPAGWDIFTVIGINDSGQIAATALDSAGNFHTVRLDPVPEPSTWLLAAAGLAVIARRRR